MIVEKALIAQRAMSVILIDSNYDDDSDNYINDFVDQKDLPNQWSQL